MIHIILIILIYFLFLRKKCSYLKKEKFSNIINKKQLPSDKYFMFLQNDIIQKQRVRNLLF